MPDRIRRIVTGHNGAGKSVVLTDTAAAPSDGAVYIPDGNPKTCLTNLWALTGLPTRFDDTPPVFDGDVTLSPPAGGLVFRTVEVPPDSERNFERIGDYFKNMAAADNLDAANGRHPATHATDTVDLVIILKGSVTLVLDEGETDLGPGDVVIQRGTNHAWSNRGTEPCVFAVVLIDAVGDRTADKA